ncbi:MAG: hypothetical protein C0481_02295 [Phenylobacterium sp.]|nr:hypothetical protein [Phenylobacterium sp.]
MDNNAHLDLQQVKRMAGQIAGGRGRSRPLHADALRSDENRLHFTVPQEVDRPTPSQTVVVVDQEVQHSPGAREVQSSLHALQSVDDAAISIELDGGEMPMAARPRNRQKRPVVDPLVHGLACDPV